MTKLMQKGSRGEQSEHTQSNLGKISYDTHLSIYAQLLGCDPSLLANEKFVTSTILASVVLGRMRVLDYICKKFEGGGGGITAVAIVSDSHIIVNTFPEIGLLVLDVYACTGAPIRVLKEFVRRFNPKSYEFTILPRALGRECVRTKVILDHSNAISEDLSSWLEKRKLIPLLSTSEEALTLAEIAGFLFASGTRVSDRVAIEGRDRLVLEVLKERLRQLEVETELTVVGGEANVFRLTLEDETFPKLLKLLGMLDDSGRVNFPSWIEEDDIPIVATFLSAFLTTKMDEVPTPGAKKVELLRDSEVSKLEAIRRMLRIFHIESNLVRKGREAVLEVDLTEKNLLRMKALTSLTKIYPLSIFPTSFDFDDSEQFHVDLEAIYGLLEKLLEGNEGLSLGQVSSERERAYLATLIEAGIVREEDGYLKLNFLS